jgi:hypothetical protein
VAIAPTKAVPKTPHQKLATKNLPQYGLIRIDAKTFIAKINESIFSIEISTVLPLVPLIEIIQTNNISR